MTPEIYRKNEWAPLRGWLPAMFNDFFNSFDGLSNVSKEPSINVKETEDSYIMEVAALGVNKDHCKVNVDEERNLCISIESKVEEKEENSNYIRKGFSYTNFNQKYALPKDVEETEINAKVEDGILKIDLPKTKKKKKLGRTIEIG